MKINLHYLSIWTFNLNIHKKCNLSLKKNNNEGNLIMNCFSPIHFGNTYLHPFVQCFLQPVFAKIKALLNFLLECLMRLENTWQVTRDIPSSRISPDPSDSQLLLFSSPHSSSTGFRSEKTWQVTRDHSFIQNLSRSFRFTASSLQFTSLIFYRVQVREHRTSDQRHSFLQNHSRPFRFTASSLQFTSLIFYRVQVRGLGEPANHSCSVTQFCVDLDFFVLMQDPTTAK